MCVLVPNPIAQTGLACARMECVARLITGWANPHKSECNFPAAVATGGTPGVKRFEIPSDFLHTYREELRNEETGSSQMSSAAGTGEHTKFVVLTGNTGGVMGPWGTRPIRQYARRSERKLSTKSLA